MTWKQISEDLPKGDVLARSDKDGLLLGYLFRDEYGKVYCASNTEILYNVIEYIDDLIVPRETL